ncbi:MAG: NAD(P)/FAD-dependent oxidoreductase [Lachnospiraceae bacterium]|nr:NAD(P)/FAD-dependent oxidoreductase [Lachnospiraceae bacterium]
MSRSVLIIGGGASGLMAAIQAARLDAAVTILEQNTKPGKKLLCTGNGKCNLTNTEQESTDYRGTNPGFARDVLKSFTVQDTIRFFLEIGIYTKNRSGYVYPYSEQAASVLETLEMEARYRKVKIKTKEQVQKVAKTPDGFAVTTGTWTYTCDRLILAAGSCASSIEGATGSGYALAESLGHSMIKPLPALVPLQGSGNYFSKWAGVRVQAQATLIANDLRLKQVTGEVQLTDYGLSGIPIFQLSRYVARLLDEHCTAAVSLDFLPDFTLETLIPFLENRMQQCPYKNMQDALVGLFPKKLIEVLMGQAQDVETLAECIKDFVVPITRTLSFEHAQVCSGGVATEEIFADTMESRLVPGLFFAGEVVDIDGACGGYNLQWAWSSGTIAGRCAAGE